MNGNSCITNYNTMEVQSDNAMEELSDNIAEEEFQIYESPKDESQQGAQVANDSYLTQRLGKLFQALPRKDRFSQKTYQKGRFRFFAPKAEVAKTST